MGDAAEVIKGTIQNISRPFGSGWRFASVHPHGTVVGELGNLQPGDLCIFHGKWKSHPKYGKQFEARQAQIEIPKDKQGIREYLGRHFKWIGPTIARGLTEAFGEDLFTVMEKEPGRLASIQGITPARAWEIHAEYLAIRDDQEYDVFFASHGITLGARNRLVDHYGSKAEAVRQIRANPYALAEDVWGIGFKKADRIALSIGIRKDSEIRANAGVQWVLQESAEGEGHCFLPEMELLKRSREILESGEETIRGAIRSGIASEKLTCLDGAVYRTELLLAETLVAEKLRTLASAHHEEMMQGITREVLLEMDSDQQQALRLALQSKICVITGGPGCGKTYTVNKIIEALGERRIELAAPTGKAAKRMAEITGRPARTIHRLLEFNPIAGGFRRNRQDPLECETLIIDETSMIDIRLMASLMDAVTPKIQVIFVGDVDQLPSVGPGRVLADMIESGVIPTARLKTLHRQAAASYINVNAQRINRGEKLDLNGTAGDFWFYSEADASRIPEIILKACKAVPRQFGFSLAEIQVLCPQKRGPIGTENLNKELRPVLNYDGQKLPGVPFMTGDRVIQTRNNYKLDVFNGDIGRIDGADEDGLIVSFEDLQGERKVRYPLSDVGELQLAYALTIHKCVSGETLVETNEGLRPIQNIPLSGTIASHEGAKFYKGWIANDRSRLLTITTKDGYRVTVTPEHGMDMWDGEHYSRQQADQIRPGDFLRLKLGAVIDPENLVRTPAPSNGDVREIVFDVPLYVDEGLAEFLGLFVADGALFHGGFRLLKRHKEVADRFAELCMKLFGVDAKRFKKGNAYCSEVSSTFLSRWVSSIGGTLSNRKNIPECILQSPMRIQARFLRGLFEDGSVLLNDGALDRIEFSNKFQSIVDSVRIMLLRFGIISGTTTSSQPNIQIYGCNAKKFASRIGLISEFKLERFSLPAGKETRYVAPISKVEALKWYSDNREAFGKFNYQNARDRGYISREQLKRLSGIYFGEIREQIESKLAYHHSRVKCIKESEGPSFCVEVPDGHQFLQNGFCGWNSQGSEFPVVIIPVHTSNYMMLKRNLLYTGITRGKKLVVLVGAMKAVNVAIRTMDSSQRFSNLKSFIAEGTR